MVDFSVVAESTVHRGRRLLLSDEGRGYLQLDPETPPLPLSDEEFALLKAMRHYRPVSSVPARPRPAAPPALVLVK